MKISSVFILEDDEDWIELYEIDFRKNFKAEVVSAKNLERALDIVKVRKFDLYVTDGDFPLNPNGIVKPCAWRDFYRNLKTLNDQPRVVLISGGDYEQEAAKLEIIYVNKSKYNINELVSKH